jgi:DNA repair protein RecO (recombination protein O)
MIERATGLILRTRLLTETSLIVEWLTPDLGRIHTVAKGARRPKSPLRGKLDLFFLCDFSFQRSRRSDLHILREGELRHTHEALRRDLKALQQASYAAALVTQTTEIETPLPQVFQLMLDLLKLLADFPARTETVFIFETKLLHELGLRPSFSGTKLSRGAQQILEKFMEDDWDSLNRLKLSEAQLVEIRQFLHGFLIYHLGKIPKGRPGMTSDK